MKGCERKFIIAVWGICLSMVLPGCGRAPEKLTKATTGMGTVVQETVYVMNEELGREGLYEISMILQSWESEVLSWRVEGTELADINASAGSVEGCEVTEWMGQYLDTIWDVSEKSNGALDVTVGEITRLWNLDEWAAMDKDAQKSFTEPSAAQLETLLENVGYEKVIFQEGRVYLPEKMKLDLGAVGKGIVCDEIGEYLGAQKVIQSAIITVGGSVVTYGEKPDGSPWNVAIVHPREEGAYLGSIYLKGEWYVATSGDYERYIKTDDKRYHHIMDPDTGYPAESGVCSVTIVSKSGLLSDALSTACFVLGVEDGLTLAGEYDAEALIVTEDMTLYMTEGMKELFQE